MLPADLDRLHLPSARGGLVPLSALASGRWVFGSPRLERYNSVPSINIQGEASPGRSSGEAMRAMEELIAKLPKGIGHEWTGLSYQERMAESQTGLLYAFSVLAIFLVLAALYESWTVPISDRSGAAARRAGGRGGFLGTRDAQRRLLPDRAAHRARLDHQERHPHRAVRQAIPRRGDGPDRGHVAGGPSPLAADRHDLAGVRIRRAAARGRRPGPARERSRPSARASSAGCSAEPSWRSSSFRSCSSSSFRSSRGGAPRRHTGR